jgi:NAD(P)-dependent dehydrogenase (short-subunit alcohol dehydrogenase family)
MLNGLDGKTAVVTGGASGIGLALAEAFGARGMNVAIADVEEGAIAGAVGRLESAGIRACGILADVSDRAAVDRLAEEVIATYGAVHVLCNNAGVAAGGVTWELPEEVWRWVLDVDLWGVINGVHSFVPGFVEQGEGHVVNTASFAGLVASPGMAPYSAAKHAVIGLSASLREDLKLAGGQVGVSVLCPSFTRTRMNESGRNWPARLGPPPVTGLAPGHPQTRARFLGRMSDAISPELVADQTSDAILADRFWVLPNPEVRERYAALAEEVLASIPQAAADDGTRSR